MVRINQLNFFKNSVNTLHNTNLRIMNLVMVLSIALSAIAQKTFTGAVNDQWNEAGNWFPAGVPTNTDDVIISADFVNISSSVSARSVVLQAGPANTNLTINGGNLTTDSLFLNQNSNDDTNIDLYVRNGGQLNVNGNAWSIRDSINKRNRRMRLYLTQSSSANIAGTFRIETHGGQNENSADLRIEDDAQVNIGGNLEVLIDSADANARFVLENNAQLLIDDSLVVDIEGEQYFDNADFFLNLVDNSSVQVYKSFVTNHNGGDATSFSINDDATFSVSQDFIYNHFAGGLFEFRTYNNAAISVLGNTEINGLGESTSSPNEYLIFDFNGGTANFQGATSINLASSPTDRIDFYLRADGAQIAYGSLSINQSAGDDLFLQINNASQANPASFTVNGNLNIIKSGGNNVEIDLDANAFTQIIGDINFDITSNGTDNVDWEIRNHNIAINDLNIKVDGAANVSGDGDFDIRLNASRFDVEDIKVDFNAMRDFRLFLDPNASTGGGAYLFVADSLIVNKGSVSDDIIFENSINAPNSKFEANYIAVSLDADAQQAFVMNSRGVNDSVLVHNDFIVTASGVDNNDNDVRFDVDNGYFLVDNDFLITTSDMADIAFVIDNAVFSVANALSISENSIGKSSVLSFYNTQATIGSIYMEGGFNEEHRIYVRDESSLNVEDSIVALVMGGQDYYIIVGENNASKGLINVGSDVALRKTSASDDIGILLRDGSRFNIGRDLVVENEMETSDRVYINFDTDNDTLTVGRDFIVNASGGTTGTEDDFYFDKNSGVFTVDGNFVLNYDGADDIVYEETGVGYTSIGGDLLLDIDNADDFTWRADADSLHVYGITSVDMDGSSSITFNIDGGLNQFDQRVALNNNNSNSNITWDQDGGVANVLEDLIIQSDNSNETRLYLDNDAELTITDSLILNLGAGSGIARVRLNDASGAGAQLNAQTLAVNQNGGGSVELYLFDHSIVNVSNNIDVDFEADGGDFFEIVTRDSDTILIGNNLLVDFNSGTGDDRSDIILDIAGENSLLSISNDVLLNSTESGEVFFDFANSHVNVDGRVEVQSDNSRGFDWDIDNASFTIAEDVVLSNYDYNTDNNSINYLDVDGNSQINIGTDFNISYNSSKITEFRLSLDSVSSLVIGDTFNIDVEQINGPSYVLLNNSTALGGGARLDVGTTFNFIHGAQSGDVLIQTNENSKINITEDFIVNHATNGGDYFELEMRGPSDTVLVNGDLLWDIPSGSDNGDDEFRWDINSGNFIVRGNATLKGQDDGGIRIEVNDANALIDGNLSLETNSGREEVIRVDNSTLNVGEGITFDCNECTIATIESNNGSAITIGDSLIINTGISTTESRIYLNATGNSNFSSIEVGSSVQLNHATTSPDFLIFQNGNTKFNIVNDFIADFSTNGGDEIELRMMTSTDSLLVGNNLSWEIPTGSYLEAGAYNGNDDIVLNIYDGYVNVGNDLLLNVVGASDALYTQNAGDVNVLNNFTISADTGAVFRFNQAGGSLNIAGEFLAKAERAIANTSAAWSVSGSGSLSVGADLEIIIDGLVEDMDMSVDGDALVNISDSVLLRTLSQNDLFQVDFNNSGSIGQQFNVGSSFYIDHRAEAGDFYFYLRGGNSSLNITDDFIANFEADGGDILDVRVDGNSDSLKVGRDLNFAMPLGSLSGSGSYEGNDDIFFRVFNGYSSIGNDLTLEVTGGSEPIYDQNAGISEIGGDLNLFVNDAAGFRMYMDDGELNIAGSLNAIVHNSLVSTDCNWQFFGGETNIGESVELRTQGNNRVLYGSIEGDAKVNITDTLFFNNDEQTGTNRLLLNNPEGNGPELNVGYLIFDHEEEGRLQQLQLNGNANLSIDNDLIGLHDASGNDDLLIQVQSASDSLIVGGDIYLSLSSTGAINEDNDIQLNVLNGYVDVGDSILLYADSGSELQYRNSGGEVQIGSSFYVNAANNRDVYLLLENDGVTQVAEDVVFTMQNHDDFVMDFNNGDVKVGGNLSVNMLSGDGFLWDQENGNVNVTGDVIFDNSGSGEMNIYLDNQTTWQINDSLLYNSNVASISRFYLNDGGGTGASVNVVESAVFNHDEPSGDVLVRLEGDSKIDIKKDLLVNHNTDGVSGDYFRIELEEAGGSDSLIVGRNLVMIGDGSGSASDDNDLTLELNGGYLEVLDSMLMVGNNLGNGDVLFDINGGKVVLNKSLTMLGTSYTDDVNYALSGGEATILGDVLVQNQDGDLARFSHQGVDGSYPSTINVETYRSAANGARFVIGGTGNVLFEDTVVVKSIDGGETIFRTNGSGQISFQENVYVLDSNSADLDIDLNGSIITLQKDFIVSNIGGDEFYLDVDGGELTIGDDFTITSENTTNNTTLRFDNSSSLIVQDSLQLNVTDNGNRTVTLYMDDGNAHGSNLQAGAFYYNHNSNVGDTRFYLEGDANFIVDNDMVINNDGSGGDYFEIELANNNTDTLLIGGDFLINHTDDGNGDVILQVLGGYADVGKNLITNVEGTGDADLIVDVLNSGVINVSDTLLFNMDRGDDIDLDFEGNSQSTFGTLIIDKEAASDEANIQLRNNAAVTVVNDFHWMHDGSERDLGYLQFVNDDPILNAGNFILDINIDATSNNGNNDFRLDMNTGTINIDNDFIVNFLDGLDLEFTMDGASVVNVGRNLHINKDGGRNAYIDLGTSAGVNQLNIEGNFNMDVLNDGSNDLELELNNASLVDVNGDIQFNTNNSGQLLIDINGASELQIAGAIDRAINGNEYGKIECESTSIITYDGSAPQIMEEEAGGGSDNISYGIVQINNTSGVLPAVVLEDNLGGSASITGLQLEEGQLYLNQQTLTVISGASSAVTRTSGSVRSEDTDNSSVLRWFISSNTGAHLFPFSTTAGEYLPLTLDVQSGNAGIVDVATYPTSVDNQPYSPTVTEMKRNGVDNTLNVVDRHWQIDVSGSPVIDMSIPYIDSEYAAPNTITESNLRAQRWNNTVKGWDEPVGAVDIGDKVVNVSGVTTFSPWVLVDGIEPLPVQFIAFEANQSDKNVLLTWATSMELNNDYFEILVSTDGVLFEAIAQVDGVGNSDNVNEYEYVVADLANDLFYFKIRQVDIDGKWSETNIQSVAFSANSISGLTLYPSVVQSGEIINLKAGTGETILFYTIVDEKGRLLNTVDVHHDSAQITSDLFASGLYFIQVFTEESTANFKLIVE